jgi:D-arabinose 1-dehydrogenase-like Zn-dependent alcohol dehydrogenase
MFLVGSLSTQAVERKMMRSYRLLQAGENLHCQEIAIPTVENAEVLVKVAGCGVCRTDWHLQDGGFDLGGGKTLPFYGLQYPVTPGHEISGTIAASGPQAGDAPVGRKVLVFPWVGCGECANCLSGLEHLCFRPQYIGIYRDGGYADYVRVPHGRYLIDIDDMDAAAAAPLACSGLTTYSAIKKLGQVPQDCPVVIIGAGGLGLMAVGILKMLGARPLVVLEIDPCKREAALEAGAAAAIDPQAEDSAKQIRKAVGQPIRTVLDLVGSGGTVRQAVDLLAVGGKIVVVGLLGGTLELPTPLLALKSITIEGSFVGSLNELHDLVALVRAHGAPSMPIEVRPLDDAIAALDSLEHGSVVGRIVLTPSPDA